MAYWAQWDRNNLKLVNSGGQDAKRALGGGESLLSKMWNSEIARFFVADMINVMLQSLFLVGREAHLLTRGPDAGLYTSFTHSNRLGLFVDLSGGVSVSRHLSLSAGEIKYSDYLGDGLEAGGKIAGGLSGSISYNGIKPTWITVGYSEGFSLGSYIGASTTYPLLGRRF